MGNTIVIKKINFEWIQNILNDPNYTIINTLPNDKQNCLIKNTLSINEEIKFLNDNLNNPNINIVLYGLNSNDDSIINKYKQLLKLGYSNIYVYTGGIFEWLLLQDIYGFDNFKTTSQEIDILKFK